MFVSANVLLILL